MAGGSSALQPTHHRGKRDAEHAANSAANASGESICEVAVSARYLRPRSPTNSLMAADYRGVTATFEPVTMYAAWPGTAFEKICQRGRAGCGRLEHARRASIGARRGVPTIGKNATSQAI
jgi:hypothetical protein